LYPIHNPDEMTPAERFTEVAWILAKGYLRLNKQDSLSISTDPDGMDKTDQRKSISASERLISSEISAKELDLSNP